jgi:TetR/AcrR family transcriptional regulator, lmrAB and yxaGH operons repressor
MTKEKMTREKVLACLFEQFRRNGYDGVSLSSMSEVTGLGRSSLYHYFPLGKEQIVTEVLEYGHELLLQNILLPLKGEEKPYIKIQAMCKTLLEFYDYGRTPCLLGTLIVGNSMDIYQDKVGTSLKCWMTSIAEVLKEAGINENQAIVKAENTIISIQGGLLIAKGTADPMLFVRQIELLQDTLLPNHN